MKQNLAAQNQDQKRVELSLQIIVIIILRSPGIGIFRFSIQYSFVLQIFLLYVKFLTADKSEMFLYLLTELFFFHIWTMSIARSLTFVFIFQD